MNKGLRFYLTLLFLLAAFHLFAQTKNAPAASLESPYNAMWVHLYYLQPDTYAPEISAQTIPGVSDSTRAVRLAIRLKQILDGKGLFVRMENIPRDSNFIDTTTNKPYYTPFPAELPEIYLEKIDGQWFYSTETVALAPSLHKEVYPFGSDILINLLPGHFGQKQIFGMAAWQFLGIAIVLLVMALLHLILSRILKPIVRRLSRSRLNPELVPEKLIWKIARIASVLILLQVVKIFLPALLLHPDTMEDVVIIFKIVTAIVLLLLLLRVLDVGMLYAGRFTEKTTSKLDEQLLPLVRKMIQVVLVIGAVIHILSLLNVNVTALIAGVGIGGLALALAAQDTVKNLIGSAMIFVDQPFQIGDWIEGGGVAGTVVEVGFRTTRVRQPDSSIIAVPNGSIANIAITNLGMRIFRLFQFFIGVTYDTPPDLMEKYIEGLKQIILNHPKTMKENYFVHFNALADSSMNILFRVSLEVADYGEEQKTKEELLFAIIRLAETLGVQFAFPSSTLYVEQFPGKISQTPTYEKDQKVLSEKVNAFIEDFKKQADQNDAES